MRKRQIFCVWYIAFKGPERYRLYYRDNPQKVPRRCNHNYTLYEIRDDFNGRHTAFNVSCRDFQRYRCSALGRASTHSPAAAAPIDFGIWLNIVGWYILKRESLLLPIYELSCSISHLPVRQVRKEGCSDLALSLGTNLENIFV